jgi:hypothetical protein
LADEPLLELEESWVFGMLWPKRLLIFEDRIETRGSELLQETVETTRYGEVKDVVVGGAGWSTSLLIKRNGNPILLRGVEESAAGYAKTLIEERISHPAEGRPNGPDLIRKLVELRDAGVLSPEEFEAKKKSIDEADPRS